MTKKIFGAALSVTLRSVSNEGSPPFDVYFFEEIKR
jgi:hypothetical protein